MKISFHLLVFIITLFLAFVGLSTFSLAANAATQYSNGFLSCAVNGSVGNIQELHLMPINENTEFTENNNILLNVRFTDQTVMPNPQCIWFQNKCEFYSYKTKEQFTLRRNVSYGFSYWTISSNSASNSITINCTEKN